MQRTRTREGLRPSSIFEGVLSPGLSSQSSSQTRRPSERRRSATARTTGLSCELWLRNTSYLKSSSMLHLLGTRAEAAAACASLQAGGPELEENFSAGFESFGF